VTLLFVLTFKNGDRNPTPHAWRMAKKSMGSAVEGFMRRASLNDGFSSHVWLPDGSGGYMLISMEWFNGNFSVFPSKRSGFDPDFSLKPLPGTGQDRSSQTSLRNSGHFSGNLRPQKIELVLEFNKSNPSVCKRFKPPDFRSVGPIGPMSK
jgi:hypothetical protein